MSKQVDNRVVQMQFDNKKFEQGIKTTLNSINNLDKSLNGLNNISLKGFEKITQMANKINLDGIGQAIDMVSYRMSSMGIVGATVLQNLTNEAINAAKSLANITIGQIMTGGKNRALNIEAAKFQLEGLGVAWEDIKEDINYGVKDTAYGLDAAAKAASQLVASQVKLGDEMKMSLRGISGVAAMTNSSYEDISNIFTTVAGNGRLYAQQLQQFSARGLNAAATLAKSLGKSEAEIREMVSKGKIDFKMFAKAMDDAFGEHAKDANKTFTGALLNMKAALSRIGAEFYTPGLEYARDTFNAITGAVDQFKKSLADNAIFENVSNIMGTLSKNAVEFFNSISDNRGMDKFIGDTLKNLRKGLEFVNEFLSRGLHLDILRSIGGVVGNIGKVIKAVFAGIKSAFPSDVINDIQRFLDKVKTNTEVFDRDGMILVNVEKAAKGLASALGIVVKAASTLFQILKPGLTDILSKFKIIFRWAGDLGDKISEYYSNFNVYTKWSKKLAEIKEGFVGIKLQVEQSLNAINERFKANFGKDIPELIETIKEKIKSMFSSANGDEAKKGIDWFGLLSIAINIVTKALLILIDVLGTFYQVFGGGISIFELIKGGLDAFVEKFNEIIAFMKGNKDADLFSNLSPDLKDFLTDVRDVFNNFKQIVKDAFKAIKPAVKGIMDMLKSLTFKDIVGAGATAGGVVGIKLIIDKLVQYKNKLQMLLNFFGLSDGKTKYVSRLGESLNTVLASTSTAITQFTQSMKVNQLKTIAITMAILAGSILVLSSINTEGLTTGLAAVSALLWELVAVIKVLEKTYFFGGGRGYLEVGTTLLLLSVSVGILASSLKKLSRIEPDRLETAFGVLTSMFVELGAALYLLSKYITDMPKVGATLLAIAFTIKIITSALSSMAKIAASGQLISALMGLTIVLAEIAYFAYFLSENESQFLKGAASLLLFAVALNLMMIPIIELALISAGGQLIQAITGITVLLGEIIAFSAIMEENNSGFMKAAASLIIFAVALNLMTVPLLAIAAMQAMTGKIGEAFLALSGIIALMVALMFFATEMGDMKSFAGMAASLILFSVALNLLVIPLQSLASIQAITNQLGPAFLALSGILALMIAMIFFADQMGDMTNFAIMSASLILLAVALNALMVPLMTLSMMSTKGLVKAVVALAAILAVLAGFLKICSGLVEAAAVLLALGAAIMLIGAAVMFAGVGIGALGIGIYAVVLAFTTLLETIQKFRAEIFYMSIDAALAIATFIVTLGSQAPAMGEAVTQIIIAACDALLGAAEKIVSTLWTLWIMLLEHMAKNAPKMAKSLIEIVFGILTTLIDGLTEKVPILAQSLYNFCMTVISELTKLMRQAPLDLIDIFFGGGFKAKKNSGKKLTDYFKDIFKSNKDNEDMKEAGEATADGLIDSAAEKIQSKDSQDKMSNSLTGLLSGSAEDMENDSSIPDAMTNISEKGIAGFEDPLNITNGESQTMASLAGYTQDGFLNNIDTSAFYNSGSGAMGSWLQGAKDKGGIASPSKEAMKLAEWIDKGFAKGLNENSYAENASIEKMGNILGTMSDATDMMQNFQMPSLGRALKTLFESDSLLNDDLNPTITPVLDLSNVSQGFSSLNSMFSSQRSLALAGEAAYMQDAGRRLSMELQNKNNDTTNNGINALGNKLDRLGDAILNKQIVLDSGEVVGGLADPMDRALGIKMIRAQRGGRR